MNQLILSLCILLPSTSFAVQGWSWNLGYNNPPGATVGVNLMHQWTRWAFEVGVGSAKVTDSADSTAEVTVLAGQLDMKYLWGASGFRPYAQLGTGYAAGSGNGSAGLSVGGSAYGGLGFFAMGSSVYGYTSYNLGNAAGSSGFVQAGIGFDL